MPNKSTINFSTILKRSTCLNSISHESANNLVDKLFERVEEAVAHSKNGNEYAIKNSISSYIEAMSNTYNASRYYWKPLKLMSEMNKKEFYNVANSFNHQYVTRILPYVEDVNAIKDELDRFLLTEDQQNYIIDSVNKNNIADRILGNYNSLYKRFNLENSIVKYRTGGIKAFVDTIAEMVDTYNTKNYQKMNVTLEEVDYILCKEGIKYDKADMAKYVAKYYLSQSPYLTETELNNYRRTLKENYILTESDLDSVKYVLEGVDKVTSIESGINNFLLIKNKSPEVLSESINNMLESTSNDDIIYNSNKITSLLWDLSKNAVFEDAQKVYDCNSIIVEHVSELNRDELSLLIDSYNESINIIRLSGNSNPDYAKESIKFIDNGLTPCIESLNNIKDIIYDESNIEAINYINSDQNDGAILPLKEYKIFKFHNLVRAAFNLDKFLKVKEKRIIDNGKNKLSKFMKKAKNVLFGEAANEIDMLKYIGEDGRATLVVRQYIYNESEVNSDDMHGFLKEICREYNDILISQNETCRAYYIINSGIAEIKLTESTKADISDFDIYSYIDESFDTYLEVLGEVDTELNVNKLKFRSLYENIEMMNRSEEFTFEQFELALEAMSIIGIDKGDVNIFANEFIEYNFNNAILGSHINESYMSLSDLESKVNSLVESWVVEQNASFQDKIEAYKYLQGIFEYSFPDSDDDDDEDDEDEDDEEDTTSKPEVKKPKVGGAVNKKDDDKKESSTNDKDSSSDKSSGKANNIQANINSIKIGLKGLKAKFGELNTKYKEAARNMDSAVRAFTNATKNALTNDRREAIIKGSVIPSFSRCIKASIILAGVAAFSVPTAVIGAIGALAISKKLNKRERLLLLDEIETEIDVVDKELQIADSNNQINKYRELLKYKKNLQRQYQRIRYNIRIGKDILPGSSNIGTPGGED